MKFETNMERMNRKFNYLIYNLIEINIKYKKCEIQL